MVLLQFFIFILVDEKDEVSIADAAEIIKKSIGFKGELIYDTSKPDGQFKKTASNKKLRQLLPNFQFTKFDDAIIESVQWFVKNKDSARK